MAKAFGSLHTWSLRHSHGCWSEWGPPRNGWINWKKNDLEFDPSTCFEIINREFTPWEYHWMWKPRVILLFVHCNTSEQFQKLGKGLGLHESRVFCYILLQFTINCLWFLSHEFLWEHGDIHQPTPRGFPHSRHAMISRHDSPHVSRWNHVKRWCPTIFPLFSPLKKLISQRFPSIFPPFPRFSSVKSPFAAASSRLRGLRAALSDALEAAAAANLSGEGADSRLVVDD